MLALASLVVKAMALASPWALAPCGGLGQESGQSGLGLALGLGPRGTLGKHPKGLGRGLVLALGLLGLGLTRVSRATNYVKTCGSTACDEGTMNETM